MAETTPAGRLRSYYMALEAGEIEKASDAMPKAQRAQDGTRLTALLASMTSAIKQNGGVKKLDITQVELIGDIATMSVVTVFGNGMRDSAGTRMIREEGKWVLLGR